MQSPIYCSVTPGAIPGAAVALLRALTSASARRACVFLGGFWKIVRVPVTLSDVLHTSDREFPIEIPVTRSP